MEERRKKESDGTAGDEYSTQTNKIRNNDLDIYTGEITVEEFDRVIKHMTKYPQNPKHNWTN